MAKFIGFTSIGQKKTARVLVDRDLALRDLKNHFYTKIGTRLGEPKFGTTIYEYVMQPNDEITQSDVEEEVRRVIRSDPRWTIDGINVDVSDHQITVAAQLIYNNEPTPVELLLRYTNENT